MKKNVYPGKFIVFEGLDGAGKSTQAAKAVDYLKLAKKPARLTYEPTQLMVGSLVRSCLLGEWACSPECLQLLFAADRDEHLKKEVLPGLKNGSVIVGDRYFMSSLAYGAIDCDFDWLVQANREFLAPDLVIYLDVPSSVCVDRIAANGKSIELFEKSEALEKVAQKYKKVIDMFKDDINIAIIDGNRGREEVFSDVKKTIEKIL
jgi:dTMP kinase